MVQISTDHVFDGEGGPYSEEDRPNPINYYGRTKLAAENICIRSGVEGAVIRTMWLYGARNGKRLNFLDWVIDKIARNEEIPVTDDEIGNPTHYEDLSYGIIRCIEQNGRGTIHIAGPERVSRKDWVTVICQQLMKEKECHLRTIKSSELTRPARRPLASGLISMRARYELGITMSDVREGVEMAIVRDERNEE
jgi:dTDP-4-dehydrorhamnose reductase